jgi:HEAT repeat protein
VAAVPALISMAEDPGDPYLAAEAIGALVAIGTADGLAVVRRLARSGPVVARAAARKALAGEPTSEPENHHELEKLGKRHVEQR